MEGGIGHRRRSSVAFGLMLVLLGIGLLAVQMNPSLQALFSAQATWPLIIVGIGVLFLLFGTLAGVPGMAVPACIIGGIGLLLYWQNATNNWESWAYAWTLIPGFVGAGVMVNGLLGHDTRSSLFGGAWLIVISLVLYAIFASFLGGPTLLGQYWPLLIIALGVLLLVRSLLRWR